METATFIFTDQPFDRAVGVGLGRFFSVLFLLIVVSGGGAFSRAQGPEVWSSGVDDRVGDEVEIRLPVDWRHTDNDRVEFKALP